MADFLNLQINGVQIAMYSMVGLTTAVLAYATAGGALESFAAKTMGALSPASLMGSESVAALGNLTPFGSSPEDKEPEEKQEETQETPEEKQEDTQETPEEKQEQPEEKQDEKAPDESLSSLAVETGQEDTEEEEEKTTGGKKRRRKKTPKHRKSKKHNKSIKSKK